MARNVIRARLLGCPIDCLSFEETVEEMLDRMHSRHRTHIVFMNAAKVVRYARDEALRGAIDRADLLLADGKPLVWVARLFDVRLPTRVNGTDLMERIVGECARYGFRVFFLGATPEVLAKTIENFRKRHLELKVAGAHHGYFTEAEEPHLIEQIATSRADLLLVGMSTPRKELWVDQRREVLGVTIMQGVGGSFDVIAGMTKRAPVWMQAAGLEWFYRFIQEPSRMWKRYLITNAAFIWLTLRWLIAPPKPVSGSPTHSDDS